VASDGQLDADTLYSLVVSNCELHPSVNIDSNGITFVPSDHIPFEVAASPPSSSEGVRFENPTNPTPEISNEESAAESATHTAGPTPSVTLAPEGAIPVAQEGAIPFAPEEESITAPEGATPSPSTSSIPPTQDTTPAIDPPRRSTRIRRAPEHLIEAMFGRLGWSQPKNVSTNRI